MTEREALKLIADIASGSTTANSLPNIAKIAQEALAQPEQELLAWKNAALRVGEDLSSIGPNGYYNMTAQQWLDWAMAQQPRGNNSLAQPEQELVCVCGAVWEGQELVSIPTQRKPLTDEEIERLIFRSGGHKSTQNLMSNPMQVREYVELWNERIYKFARAIEAAHGIKEKNT